MKPYYQNNGVTLYHGDCLSFEIAHDLLVTDPPYGQEFKSGKSELWGVIKGDDDIAGTLERLLAAIKGLRRGRHVYIFGNRFDLTGLPLCGLTELIWDKGMIGMGDLSEPWGPQHENITFATYELSKANRDKGYGKLSARLRKGSVLRSIRPNSARVKHHPTEKPVDVLRQLIESSSAMGEIVYDPFAGSGSTLIAAVLEGREGVGCEFEERYCEIAAKRFEAELSSSQFASPLPAVPEHVLLAMAAAEHLTWVLPMAKGYAHANPVGSNAQYVADAETFLAALSPQAEPGSPDVGCADCRGTGDGPPGVIYDAAGGQEDVVSTDCPACKGSGRSPPAEAAATPERELAEKDIAELLDMSDWFERRGMEFNAALIVRVHRALLGTDSGRGER